MKITAEMVCGFGPCDNKPGERYSIENLRKILGEGMTPLEIIDGLPNIPPADKLWLLLRSEFIEEKSLHLLSCDFVEHVLLSWQAQFPDDNHPANVTAVKRRWVAGDATDDELAAAMSAAGAVWSAAGAMAVAAWATTWAATRAAAWVAVRVAAWAVRDAGAENQWQLAQVRKYFVEVNDV